MFDFLFPQYCPICNRITLDSACTSCVLSSLRLRTQLLAGTRITLFSCGQYAQAGFRTAIHAAKFEGEDHMLTRMGFLLGNIPPIYSFLSESMLVPIPLHPLRMRERGYNQAEHFAAGLRSSGGYGIAPLLTRSGSIHPQSQLNTHERNKNPIRFTCAPNLLPLDTHITLVDDVATSGATLKHAAEALHNTGYTRIQCFVLAVG